MKKYFSSITKFKYDLFVIGGGSGGIAAANQAAQFNKKIGLCDFVDPSPIGTKWGLGGTCVNVGCIPKKLFHGASLKMEDLDYYKHIGLNINYDKNQITKNNTNYFNSETSDISEIPTNEKKDYSHPKIDWNKLSSTIQMYVKKQNFGNRSKLRKNNIDYFNKKAKFIDNHTIELTDNKGKEIITADKILISVGGRPSYGNFSGNKSVITSDDIFSLKKEPGKTLVIGGSYIALETAGFLNGLGYDTTVMYRSILLRGFDKDISKKIGSYMTNKGVRFIPESIPDSIEKVNEKIIVSYKNKKEEFDTVMLAIGREAVTNYLNLDSIGLKTNKKNNKIIVSEDESTNISNIFAIGDCADNRPELTPPAIKAGRLLVNRLFNNESKIMNYKNIATTVFTPLEYGCIGYNEEEAISKFKDISVYHSEFTPLEWNLNLDNTETSYCKILCNDNDKGRIVGMHLLSPNAGEIIQGFSSAFNLGLTKDDLNDTVAIHPTIAEELVLVNKNKKDNDGKKDGC